MNDDHSSGSDGVEQENSVPISRRGVLAASGALGLGLAAVGSASAQSDDSDGPPFAARDHDHSEDYLGEAQPVGRIDVDRIDADAVSTTRYADSIAEVNEYIDEAPDERQMHRHSGVKIVLRQGVLTPSSDDLPIELKSGVVVEGQGPRTTQIDVRGIGKPVFEMDRGHRKDVTLRDLAVFGNGVDTPDKLGEPGSIGAHLDDVHFWVIENCAFFGLEDGIVAPGSFTGVVTNSHVDQCNRDGVRLDNNDAGIAANNVRIIGSAIKRSGRHNVYAMDSASLYVSGTDISGAAKYGILTDRMLGVAIHGCHFEFNGGGRPLTEGLDRDGDGDLEPVAIGLSPDSSHGPTTAVSIVGNRIGYPPDPDRTGIKLNNVDGVHVAANWNGWPNRGLIELGPLMSDVTVHNNTKYYSGEFSEGLIVGPLDGSNVPTQELNDGVWHTSAFANYDELATLAREHASTEAADAVTVVLSDDLEGTGPVIDGADFPAGTLFRGLGTRGTAVEATDPDGDAPAVSLARPGQTARDLVVSAGGSGPGVELDAVEASIEGLSIPESGGVAAYVSPRAERSSVTNVVCGSGVGGAVDVDVDGEGARVVGCDASVDTTDVDEFLDLTVDTR